MLPLFAISLTSFAESRPIVVTSAITWQAGIPNLGAPAALFVAGLDVTGVVTAEGAPLPLTLGGISVEVCGLPAPLYAVADLGGYQQVNFQVPWEAVFRYSDQNPPAAPDGCEVTVRQGSFSATQSFYHVAVAADLPFTPDFLGAFQHGADWSTITRDHPALPGETVTLYLTALPQTEPEVPTGAAAPFSPLAVVPQPVTASFARSVLLRLDGEAITPLFVGRTPGSVGLYQINFTVPPGTPAGDRLAKVELSECRAFFGGGCPASFKTTTTVSNPVILPVGSSKMILPGPARSGILNPYGTDARVTPGRAAAFGRRWRPTPGTEGDHTGW